LTGQPQKTGVQRSRGGQFLKNEIRVATSGFGVLGFLTKKKKQNQARGGGGAKFHNVFLPKKKRKSTRGQWDSGRN